MAIVPDKTYVVVLEASPAGDQSFYIVKPGEEFDDGGAGSEAEGQFQNSRFNLLKPGQGCLVNRDRPVRTNNQFDVQTEKQLLFNWEGTLIGFARPELESEGMDVCLASLRRFHALILSKHR